MKSLIKLLIWSGLLGAIAWGCVDNFQVNITTSKGYLLVEGTLTDLNEPQYISIFRTPEDTQFKSSDFTSSINLDRQKAVPITQAQVKLIVNNKDEIVMQETLAGYYYLPSSFKAKVGNTYQLWFKTTDGITYESSIESMSPVADIKDMREEFNQVGIKRSLTSSERIATNDIYIDFDDIPNSKNFYRWRWVNWEIQRVCETCRQGRYYIYEDETGETGGCYRDLTLQSNDLFDYYCGTQCWDIFYSPDINILADVYTDGQPQKNRLVAQIPLRQSNPTLVSVQQMSLSPNAFRYLKLLQDQSINTGTLADTPPAPIRGNIKNSKNEEELILGYFSVSSVSEKRLMMNRRNTTGGSLNGLFAFFNNRLPLLEDASNERPDIPLGICKNSLTRTSIPPFGWR